MFTNMFYFINRKYHEELETIRDESEGNRFKMFEDQVILMFNIPFMMAYRLTKGWPMQWDALTDPWTNELYSWVTPVLLARYRARPNSRYWAILMTKEEEEQDEQEKKRDEKLLTAVELALFNTGNSISPVERRRQKRKQRVARRRAQEYAEYTTEDDYEQQYEEPEVAYVEAESRSSSQLTHTLAAAATGFVLGRLSNLGKKADDGGWTHRVANQAYNRNKAERDYRHDLAREMRDKDQLRRNLVSRGPFVPR